jgi:hypothetical protein
MTYMTPEIKINFDFEHLSPVRISMTDTIEHILKTQEKLRQKLTQERAYYIWTENGCPQGRDLEFWNEAELQLGYKNPEPIVLETLVATEEEKNKALERLMCADSQGFNK